MIDRGPGRGKEGTVDADESLASRGPQELDGVDAEHARSAEIVREALVRLRGGAPFLSAADTSALVGWLDQGVGIARILAALELAANQRLARRVRAPLELRHARRHLGKALAAAPRAPPAPLSARPASTDLLPPLGHLDATVTPAILALREALASLPAEPDRAADAAAHAVVTFFGASWTLLGEPGRARYHLRAEAALGDLLDGLDEGERAALLEAHGRALLRSDAAGLSVTAILGRLEAR